MPNYLAIDASTEACSVALIFNETAFFEFEICPQSHSLVLLPMVDRLLKEAGCQLSDLDGLVFGQGPGSFTGVRIGVGVAQGLACSADLPVVGVSTLQAMAQQAYDKYQQHDVIATIDARMSEIYAGLYRANDKGIMTAVVQETVIAPDKLADYLSEHLSEHLSEASNLAYGVGTGWDAYQLELASLKSNEGSPEILFPDAQSMLQIALPEFAQGNTVVAQDAQPVYVRDTVSWKKLPGRE